MVASKELLVCLALGLASCGQPPRAAPLPRTAPLPHASAGAAPPVARARLTAPAADPAPENVKGWAWSGEPALMFVDGGTALLLSYGSSLTLIDPRRRAVVDELSLGSASLPDPGSNVQGAKRDWDLHEARWSWDIAHRTVVGAGYLYGSGGGGTGGLSVWAPGLQEAPAVLPGADTCLECRLLALSADAARMLVRTAASTVQLFAVATASPAGGKITLPHDPVLGAIATDGKWFATGAKTGEVELYESGSGRVETLAQGRNHELRALMFDPVRPVLVVQGDVEAIAWELSARKPTHLADGVQFAAFSPDGKGLALAVESRISIRDGATLQPIRSLDLGNANIEGIALSPDASLLAVQTHDALQIRELGPGGPPAAVDRRWFDQLHPLPVPPPSSGPAFTPDGIVEGRVTAAGRPVAGAEVRLTPWEGEWPSARALAAITARTAADGRYRLTGVPRIAWSIAVLAPGMLRGGAGADLRKEGLFRAFERPAGSPAQPVAAKAIADAKLEKAITIRGLVLGPEGRPVANARVAPGVAWNGGNDEVPTAPDGTFTIDHLPLDADWKRDGYELQAWRPDGAVVTARTAPLKAVGPIQVTLRLRAPEDPRVVRLKIVDETGAPVQGAYVEFINVVRHRSDAQGMFATDLEPRLEERGQVRVRITVEGEVFERLVPWPARGVATVAIRRTAPPGTLLPLGCILYRKDLEQVLHCDRIPRATRDALKSEFDRAAATWSTHPDRARFDCDQYEMTTSEYARLCH